MSLTNRKVVREKIVVGHSTRPVHQELLTHLEATVGTIHWRRRIDGGICKVTVANATVAQSHFVKYAEAQSPHLLNMQSQVAKRLLIC